MRREQSLVLLEAREIGVTPMTFKPEPGDLRGIPCLAKGVGGVSPGTSPEGALMAAERRRAA